MLIYWSILSNQWMFYITYVMFAQIPAYDNVLLYINSLTYVRGHISKD